MYMKLLVYRGYFGNETGSVLLLLMSSLRQTFYLQQNALIYESGIASLWPIEDITYTNLFKTKNTTLLIFDVTIEKDNNISLWSCDGR